MARKKGSKNKNHKASQTAISIQLGGKHTYFAYKTQRRKGA